tara:strand:- start:391 stop:759 length:369 start_codon:yes stop_codon:yes gene_type:complete
MTKMAKITVLVPVISSAWENQITKSFFAHRVMPTVLTGALRGLKVYKRRFEIGQVKPGDILTCYKKDGTKSRQWIITKVHPAYLSAYVSFSHCSDPQPYFEFFKSSFISWQLNDRWEIQSGT